MSTSLRLAVAATLSASLPAACANPPSGKPAATPAPAAPARVLSAGPERERLSFDAGWRFALGHATDPARDFGFGTSYFSYLAKTGYGDGPASRAFDDRGWRVLDVPHDWAIEAPFDPKASASHGFRAVGPRFPENSVGWYRKVFTVPASDAGRRISVTFDGVFRQAKVFINGFYVGEEPSGTLPATYDLSDYLRYGQDNLLAVRVDVSMEEGWYYEGAGIYRHVWLNKTARAHLVDDGTWVRTELSGSDATVLIDSEVANESNDDVKVRVHQRVLGPDQRELATAISDEVTVPQHTTRTVEAQAKLANPRLWSLADPALHVLETAVEIDGVIIDRKRTPFGVRSIEFDPNRGFFLNGKHVVLKGSNNHQDHAGVGTALPDRLQEFRLQKLKAFGSNAYRASHHPPTPELLEACDRLGMLVIDETRLMGTSPYHLSQLERMIRRDRNHASVILWSVGNEEWAIEGNAFGERITRVMQDFVRRLDPTRRSTVAISGGWGGSSKVTDVMGVNYFRHGDLDRQHADFPAQIIVGTEETTSQQTRGIYERDAAKAHLELLTEGSSGGNAELGWKHYVARPYAAGIFYWTGFDYRGEPTPFGYPAISSQFGILDTCGFAKDGAYYLKAWWSSEPVLHIAPHWNWPGREGKPIEVRVYGNSDEVELSLNGASLGRQKMPKDGHLSWQVPYAPGELKAVGFRAGKAMDSAIVATTGAVAGVRVENDFEVPRAGHRDVAVYTVRAVDAQGRTVPTGNVDVRFTLSGPGRIIGVGNGNPSSHEADKVFASTQVFPLGEWRAPDAAPSPINTVDHTAVFDRPKTTVEEGELFLNALGTHQTVTLNGRELYRDAAPHDARRSMPIKLADLKPTGNQLRFTSQKFESWGDRETLARFHPASLQVQRPAPAWRRETFNGLAQVIVETDGTPGELVLTAEPVMGAKDSLTLTVR